MALLVGAALLLIAGAELFAENAMAAGRRLGVSGLAVGLLLAGAEPEELVTALVAAARDQPGVAVGDAVGANITHLTLVAGGLALLHPVALGRRTVRYLVAAAMAAAAAWLTIADGVITQVEGVVLVSLYAVVVAFVWRSEREPPAFGELAETEDDEDDADRGAGTGLALAAVGIVLMGAGGFLAVSGAERLIATSGLAGSAIGLTAVALATTSEFLALAPAAIRRGIPELAAAGIVGSVIYNATVTLGATALLRPLDASGVGGAAAAVVVVSLVLIVAGRRRQGVERWLAIALVAAYILFVLRVLS